MENYTDKIRLRDNDEIFITNNTWPNLTYEFGLNNSKKVILTVLGYDINDFDFQRLALGEYYFQDVEHYSEANLPPPGKKWKVKGLGGTDFRPVFKYIQKKMSAQMTFRELRTR